MRRILFMGVILAAVALAQTKPAAPVPAASPTTPQKQPNQSPGQVAPLQQPPAQQAPEQKGPTQAPAGQPPAVQQPGSQQPDQTAAESGMAAALALQRASVLKQVAGVMGKAPTPAASFFTVPWVETPVPFSSPPCDAMPAADLDKLVDQSAQQEGVKADLIHGVIMQESGAHPCAVSWKGAQGLMQLMPATAAQLGVKDPFDPRQNVEGGTKLLKQLLTKYNNDVSLALAAYNAGEGRVDKDGGVPQIQETQNYVTDIQAKLTKK
jgi:soluble lytic murein transglycosylase-like protein